MLNALQRKTGAEREEQKERAALSGMAINSKNTLPEPGELEMVAKLREKFKEQLEKRKASGTHWEGHFGDIAMTRIIRGCDDNLETAEKWLARCLEKMTESGWDKFAKEAEQIVDSGVALDGNILVDVCHLDPAIFNKCANCVSGGNNTVMGHLWGYYPLCDFDKVALNNLDEKGWRNWIDSLLLSYAVGIVNNTRESVKAGKMVKTIIIFDMKDVSISGQMNKKYDDALDKDFSKITESMAAELLHQIWAVNAPWWLTQLWGALTKILPEKFVAKMKVYPADDPVLLQKDVQQMLQQCYLKRIGRSAGNTGEPSGEKEVKAGKDFEYAVSVKAGTTISWKFTVTSGELRFGGFAYWTDEDAAEIDDDSGAEVVVPQATIKTDDGEVEGELELTQDGIVTFRWDNYASMMSSAGLKYEFKH